MMITFQEACDTVNYNPQKTPPERQYVYYAYKNGSSQTFSSEEDAKRFSNMFERVCTNIDEIDVFIREQRNGESAAVELFVSSLKQDYPDLTKSLFYLIYGKAYELSHSYGYDEVANTFRDLYGFHKDIVAELESSILPKENDEDLIVFPISWDEIPTHANWIACDHDGEWFAFREKPFIVESNKTWDFMGDCKLLYSENREIHNWDRTLQHRPSKSK